MANLALIFQAILYPCYLQCDFLAAPTESRDLLNVLGLCSIPTNRKLGNWHCTSTCHPQKPESPAASLPVGHQTQGEEELWSSYRFCFQPAQNSRYTTTQHSYLLKMWEGRNTGRKIPKFTAQRDGSQLQRSFQSTTKRTDLVLISRTSSLPLFCSERSRWVPVNTGSYQKQGHRW